MGELTRLSRDLIPDKFEYIMRMFGRTGKYVSVEGINEQQKLKIFEHIGKLYEINPDKESSVKSMMKKYNDECDSSINTIVGILKEINYKPNQVKQGKTRNGVSRLPFYVKMLLYYMAYIGVYLYSEIPDEKKKDVERPTQKGVLEKLANTGYPLSKKFFSDFGVSPANMNEALNYKQIQLVTKYAGAKTGYLGYALNNLVTYVDKYDIFLDLFGGSASATMAITQKDTSEYYINELYFFNVNYYHVMADDKLFCMLMKEMRALRKKFKGGTQVGDAKNYFVECENIEKKWQAIYPIQNMQTASFQGLNYYSYHNIDDDKKVQAALAYIFIHSFQVTGGKNQKGAISKTSLDAFCNFDETEYARFHNKMKRLDGIYNTNVLDSLSEYIIEEFTDKIPKKFNDMESAIKHYRIPQANIDIKDKDLKKRLDLIGWKEDDSGKRLRKFKTLFYSDSPYLNTLGYPAGGINADQMHGLIDRLVTATQDGSGFIFSCRASMSIEDGKYSKIGEVIEIEKLDRDEDGNVIFNTDNGYEDTSYLNSNYDRVEVDARRSLKDIVKITKANYEIYRELFLYFADKQIPLYVLVCINEKKFKTEKDPTKKFIWMLTHLLPVEIFITSFDFVAPPRYAHTFAETVTEDTSGQQDYSYVRYDFAEFMELLKKYMLKTEKNYVVKKKGDESYIVER